MGMIIDASEATQQVVSELLAKKIALNLPGLAIVPLPKFLETAKKKPLSARDRVEICDQAVIILEQCYAHLAFKRARYAVDPVQRLRLLRERLDHKDEISFHSEIVNVFTDLRDVQTMYVLPPPFNAAIAFLPFLVDYYFDPGIKFVVTEIMEHFNPDPIDSQEARMMHLTGFQVGTEILAFNGIPIQSAVDLLAQQIPGGNAATRRILGTKRLTVRSLSTTIPPAEHVAFIDYMANVFDGDGTLRQERRTIAVPWHVGKGMGISDLQTRSDETSISICAPLVDLARVKSVLWRNHELLETARLANVEEGSFVTTLPHLIEVHHSQDTAMANFVDDDTAGEGPGVVTWQSLLSGIDQTDRRFGYVRIKSFDAKFHVQSEFQASVLKSEFIRILKWLNDNGFASDGLILDIRSNPGGPIVEAESMLELLTPERVTPALFHYPNSDAVQRALNSLTQDQPAPFITREFENWNDGKTHGVGSGAPITSGQRITPVDYANRFGQIYQGPVILLVDAATCGAAELFAAGFQDHGIGPIIGVDENTGGTGGKRWKHADEVHQLGQVVRLGIKPLECGASFTTAISRSSRVRDKLMQPIEDFGVEPDLRHELRSSDIPNSRALIQFAMKTLSNIPSYSLSVESYELTGEQLKVIALTSPNIERLTCLLDKVPEFVKTDLEPANGTRRTEFSFIWKGKGRLELQGFAKGALLRNGKKNENGTLELVASTLRFPKKAESV